jgi:tetratricopeptide (TPR) repeat protein
MVAAPLRAGTLCCAARLAYVQLDLPAATDLAEQSVALYRALGDQAGLAAALCVCGAAAEGQLDVVRGVALLEESLALWRVVGDRRGEADALQGLAALEHFRDPSRALSLGRQSLAIYRALNHPQDIAGLHFIMAAAAFELGDLDQAQRLAAAGLDGFRAVENNRGIADSLRLLSLLAGECGDSDRAAALSEDTMRAVGDVGGGGALPWALASASQLALDRGDLEQARAALLESLALGRAIGRLLLVTHCLAGLAELEAVEGHGVRAVQQAGALAAFIAGRAIPTPRLIRTLYDRMLPAVRASLGEEAFGAAWDSGQAQGLEHAVDYALRQAADVETESG